MVIIVEVMLAKMGRNSISLMSKMNVSASSLCEICLNMYNIYCMPIEKFFFLNIQFFRRI